MYNMHFLPFVKFRNVSEFQQSLKLDTYGNVCMFKY